MTNLEFKVSGTTVEQLASALSLRLQNNERIYGYLVDGIGAEKELVLFTGHAREVTPFLVYLSPEQAAVLAFAWLELHELNKTEPDIQSDPLDNHVYKWSRRWLAYCGDSGGVREHKNSVIAIYPYWAIEQI